MPTNRLLLAATVAAALPLSAWAQTPDPAPTTAAPTPAPPTEAEKAIDEAIQKIRALKSVSADLEMKAEMLGERFSLTGQYRKAAPRLLLLHLELKGLGGMTGKMHQVCDASNTLWDYSEVLNSRKISKLSLDPLLKALESAGLVAGTWEAPRTGETNGEGRRRKWYRLTPKGRRRLAQRVQAHHDYLAMIGRFVAGIGRGAEERAE